MSILFQTENIRVTHNPFPGGTIFVTFQSAIGVGFHNEGFGEPFLKSQEISSIHVVPINAAWYQYPEIAEACTAIKAITSRYPRVITYGTSMGGYAAVNFAHLVGATDVIAISPQYTIDPARAPRETRYSEALPRMKDGFIYDQPPGRDWSNVDAFIIYDPLDKMDRYQAEMAKADTSAALIGLRHSTHPCTQVLSIEGLKEFVHNSSANGVRASINHLITSYKRDRGNAWIYWLTLARRHGIANPRRALDFAYAADKREQHHAIHYEIGNLLLRLQRPSEALVAFEKSISLLSNPYYYAAKARALMALVAPVRAKQAIVEAEKLKLPAHLVSSLYKSLEEAKRQKKDLAAAKVVVQETKSREGWLTRIFNMALPPERRASFSRIFN